jgi:hypothetical protein
MYGQQYLEWVEGEACRNELQGLLDELGSKHGDLAYAYAINKQFPPDVPAPFGLKAHIRELQGLNQQMAAHTAGHCWGAAGALGRGVFG